MTEFGRVTKVVEPFADEDHPGLVKVEIGTADGSRQDRFTKQQIDDMVREADRCRDAVIRLSPLDDVCTHVKALAAEVEQWQKDYMVCEQERARLARMAEGIHVYTMDYEQLGIDLARMKLSVIHRDTAGKDGVDELLHDKGMSIEELAALRLQHQQLRDACVYAYAILKLTASGTVTIAPDAGTVARVKLEYALGERCPTCGTIGSKVPYSGPRAEKGDFCPTCGILIRS